MTLLSLENIPQMQAEVRALAAERGAVILAHNYQVPEVQDVADFVGDSLGLSPAGRGHRRGRRSSSAACTSWPRPPRSCRPDKTVLIPDPDAGCSLADSITAAAAARLEGQAPRRRRRDVRQHDRRGQGGDRLLRDVVERRRRRAAHLRDARRGHRDPLRSRTCSSAPTSRRRSAARCASGTASATSTPASARATSRAMRDAHPGADFLIHPECGCSTSVMEYVAAGDVSADGVHMLSTGGMMGYAARRRPGLDGDRRDRDGHAAPAARGAPRRGLRGRQRGRDLPLHEDDHAAEAARHPARRCPAR